VDREVNIEKIKELQAVIAAQPHTRLEDESGFNMAETHHLCGAPSCIDGWCQHISGRTSFDTFWVVQSELGISRDMANQLCCPCHRYGFRGTHNSITPSQAVQALQNILYGCDVEGIWKHLKDVK
jgi:hypothetical protein